MKKNYEEIYSSILNEEYEQYRFFFFCKLPIVYCAVHKFVGVSADGRHHIEASCNYFLK